MSSGASAVAAGAVGGQAPLNISQDYGPDLLGAYDFVVVGGLYTILQQQLNSKAIL